MSLSLSSGYCSHIHSAPYNNICTTHEWETETVVSSSIYPKNITNAAPKITGLIHCHAKALDNIFVLSHTPETRSKRIVYITHQPACLGIQMHYWSALFPVVQLNPRCAPQCGFDAGERKGILVSVIHHNTAWSVWTFPEPEALPWWIDFSLRCSSDLTRAATGAEPSWHICAFIRKPCLILCISRKRK